MAEPTHISSLLVYLRPEAADRVAEAILALGNAEIAAREEGRLVVVLEAEHEVRVIRGADLGELPRVSELVVVEEATVDHVPRHRHMLARDKLAAQHPLAERAL